MTATVIVPVYRLPLRPDEAASLERTCSVLADRPVTIVKPRRLDASPLTDRYPALRVESFDDDYFDGIAGYNRLMLSTEFYERFLEWDYLLICQLDAWVFRDELADWCRRGYDSIGAPWLARPVYRWPPIAAWMRFRRQRAQRTGQKLRQSLFDCVGNGGFSLRRTQSFYDAARKHSDRIAWYLAQERSHFYNEDVFWATEVPEFSRPGAEEAVRFAFDTNPAYAYRLTGGRLPFGCHGWGKRKMRRFWKPFIPTTED